jgi:GntR family transcriptional regulator
MILQIDVHSFIQASAQIVDQVKWAIALRSLMVGDMLPLLSDAASELRVNPQTVMKAYRELESEGLIKAGKALGSFVVADIRFGIIGIPCEIIAGEMDHLLADAIHLGLTFYQIRQLLDERIIVARDRTKWIG